MYEDSTKILIAWMRVIFFTAIIMAGSRLFLYEPVSVHGDSMSPTIENSDKLILAKVSSIKNFDMVVFTDSKNKYYLKRVIGLPGDQVEMNQDKLYINGKLMEETYLNPNRKLAKHEGYNMLTSDIEKFTVPEGLYYVLGDNRIHSVDSRVLGFIAKENIVGEAKIRLSKDGEITFVKYPEVKEVGQ